MSIERDKQHKLQQYLAVRQLWGDMLSMDSNIERCGISKKVILEYFSAHMEKLGELVSDREELEQILREYSKGEFTPEQFMTYVKAHIGVRPRFG